MQARYTPAWFVLGYAEELGWPANVDCGDSIIVPGGSEAAWIAWANAASHAILSVAKAVLFDICGAVNNGQDVGDPATWAMVAQQRRQSEAEKDRQWLAEVTESIARKRQGLLTDLADMRWPRVHVKNSWGRGGKWIKGEDEWRTAIADARGDPGCRLIHGDLSGGLRRFIEAVEAYRHSPRVRHATNRSGKSEPVTQNEQAVMDL